LRGSFGSNASEHESGPIAWELRALRLRAADAAKTAASLRRRADDDAATIAGLREQLARALERAA
jgi:hypothetical protein